MDGDEELLELRDILTEGETQEEDMSIGRLKPYMKYIGELTLYRWGVSHRTSASYNPHGNLRAETGVKSAKRTLRENTRADGARTGKRFYRQCCSIGTHL